MAKTRLGFDIGNSSVKIVVAGSKTNLYEIRMPDNMMKEGEIAMPHAFSEFLKKERKRLKLPKGSCGLVLPTNQVICRLVTLPKMTKEQLMLNLPYEFSEFIHDDPDKFFCDYAMCEEIEEDIKEGEEEMGEQMTLMAAAASKNRLAQYIRIFANAGFKLETLLPGEMSLIQLTKSYCQRNPESINEFCFVDIGHHAVRITIIKRDQVLAERQIDLGCAQLDNVISDLMITDPFVAGSYKLSNYQNVLDSPECMEVYQQIAVEILRVIHFYRFKYRENQMRGIYLIGGGASIPQLRNRISEMLEEDMPELSMLSVKELLTDSGLTPEEAAKGILAMGMTIA